MWGGSSIPCPTTRRCRGAGEGISAGSPIAQRATQGDRAPRTAPRSANRPRGRVLGASPRGPKEASASKPQLAVTARPEAPKAARQELPREARIGPGARSWRKLRGAYVPFPLAQDPRGLRATPARRTTSTRARRHTNPTLPACGGAVFAQTAGRRHPYGQMRWLRVQWPPRADGMLAARVLLDKRKVSVETSRTLYVLTP